MIWIIERRPVHRHDAVTKVFIQQAIVVEDNPCHDREIFVQQVHQRLRAQGFGDRAKTTDIREQDGQLTAFTAQPEQLWILSDPLDDGGMQVILEGLSNQALLSRLGQVFEERNGALIDCNSA
jgi:hypothetical protein